MLFTRPFQESWILGVTWGYTDADTRKRVGWHPLFLDYTEFYVLCASACRPLSILAKVDEAITKVDTCQLLFPSALLDRIAGWRADRISHGRDCPLSLRTSRLGTAMRGPTSWVFRKMWTLIHGPLNVWNVRASATGLYGNVTTLALTTTSYGAPA